MILNDNTNNVIELLDYFDTLTNIDKLRLGIYLIENKQFDIDFDTNIITNILKKALSILDINNSKEITNINNYKHLVFFSAKYIQLTGKEKRNLLAEIIFNIYNNDYNNDNINNIIRDLLIYEYIYSIII